MKNILLTKAKSHTIKSFQFTVDEKISDALLPEIVHCGFKLIF